MVGLKGLFQPKQPYDSINSLFKLFRVFGKKIVRKQQMFNTETSEEYLGITEIYKALKMPPMACLIQMRIAGPICSQVYISSVLKTSDNRASKMSYVAYSRTWKALSYPANEC